MSIELLDSYGPFEEYYSGLIQLIANGYHYVGQTFYNELECTLDSCNFYLRKYGTPTGSAYAKIYAMTGTFGLNGKPTGSALAVSDAFSVSGLTNSFVLKTFSFSGDERITLEADTYYCVMICYTAGDISNDVWLANDYLQNEHDGNYFFSTDGSSWTGTNTSELLFYVYGEFEDEEPENNVAKGAFFLVL